MTGEDAIARLEGEQRALAEALAEFEHEVRRLRDQLERRGGRGFVLEERLDQLERNVAATRRDLETVRKKLARKKISPP
ncbi:MAG: hypothetical protein R3337_00595 [Gammaproteobacteria bacterium]|nr:hypothetical protein [Gammaproteobacteria bacterium]